MVADDPGLSQVVLLECQKESVIKHKQRLRRVLILLLLIAVTAMLWNVFSGIENWRRDLTENEASLQPNAPDPLLRPFTVPGTPSEVAGQISQWLAQQPRWSLESQTEDASSINLHLTVKSKLLRFVDDVRVTLVPTGDRETRIQAESKSRVGVADFGQNPRNLRELVRGIGGDR